MAAALGEGLFTFDVQEAKNEFATTGWFHRPGGVDGGVMADLTDQVAAAIGSAENELAAWRYPEKKQQFLWEPPTGRSVEDLCRAVAAATGLDPDRTRCSERHVKVYSATAPEMPPAHKDRSASAVTVGIGIDIPEDSRLVMWPDVETSYNPYPTAAEWRQRLPASELPEVLTAGVAPIEVDLRRGDVVMFRGAEIYHERHLPASTSVLYLKFNDVGLDPLGEDPRTTVAEAGTDAVLARGVSSAVSVAVGGRVVGLRVDELFPALGVTYAARLIDDERGEPVSAAQAEALRRLSLAGPMSVDALGLLDDDLESLARRRLVFLS